MILVDTSVLIDYLRGTQTPKTAAFDEILERGTPFGICDSVYQELLQGAKTEKEFRMLKEYLETLLFYGPVDGRESYEKAAHISFRCRRAGVTVRSTIDALIAQIALENGLYLLHDDRDFDSIARVVKELKIYSPLSR